jgi:hypothetical protein
MTNLNQREELNSGQHKIKSLAKDNTNIDKMTYINKTTERKLMLFYVKGTRNLCKERRAMKRKYAEETSPNERDKLEFGIRIIGQEIELRKRRILQWKKDPCGSPENIFASVSD